MNIKELLKQGSNIYELPLRVCYYARVSTEHEEQQSSITNQINYFNNYITSIPNWKLIDKYIDEGISAKSILKRENFIRMINDAKNNKFDLILTKSVSRFARNTIDSIYYTNLLLDIGIGVYFLNDNINTFYSDSEFRLTLMASIAQDELRKLSENVKFGLKQSINRGIVLGSNNLLGYNKEKGKLTIKEKDAKIVKEIYNLYLKDNNYTKISKLINKKYNKKLNSSSIKRILTNPKYKGYYCGKKTEIINYKQAKRHYINKELWLIYKDNNIPPIIKEEVWNKVNSLINSKINISTFPLKNKVYCKYHGLVTTKKKVYKDKTYYYFICKQCFRVSYSLLNKIIKNKDINKILITNNDILKIDIY